MHLKDRRANYDYAMFDKWMHDYFKNLELSFFAPIANFVITLLAIFYVISHQQYNPSCFRSKLTQYYPNHAKIRMQKKWHDVAYNIILLWFQNVMLVYDKIEEATIVSTTPTISFIKNIL